MVLALLPVAGLGLVLGLRHAFEPDHLAAVSTLAARRARLRDGAWLGTAWGLGHTLTVGAIGLGVTALGFKVPAGFSVVAELVVAAVLLAIGVPVVLRYALGRWHIHAHRHGGAAHLHLHSHAAGPSHGHTHPAWDARRSLGLGLLHGVAGSGALVVLLVAAAPTFPARVAYVAAFGAGSTAGMLLVSLAVSAAARWAVRGGAGFTTALHVSTAGASVVAGVLLAGRTLGAWWGG
jgi:hypothetical protein